MTKTADAMDRARKDFVDQVEAVLGVSGWVRRPTARHMGVTFTLPVGNGVIAVAEFQRFPGWSFPRQWPVTMVVHLGAGYEPLLALLPRLAWQPMARLCELTPPRPDPDGKLPAGFKVDIGRVSDMAEAVRMAAEHVERLAVPFAEGFDGAESFLALARIEDEDTLVGGLGRDKGPPSSEFVDLSEAQLPPMSSRVLRGRGERWPPLLALLALSGDPQRARDLLAQMDAEDTEDTEDAEDPEDGNSTDADFPERGRGRQRRVGRRGSRFARQLARWLDAGAPTAPALEQTMELLSRTARGYQLETDRAARSANRALVREATDEVRGHEAGRTDEELAGLLRHALDAREVRVGPTLVALLVMRMRERRRSLGRARALVSGARLTTDAFRIFLAPWVGLVRGGPLRITPAELEPPEADGFPVARGEAWLVPRVRPDAPILDRALAAGLPAIGPVVKCEAWLTRGPDGTAVVHLGQEVVGDLDAVDNQRLAEVWRAADLFDERPVLSALLSRLGPGGTLLLEVALP